jgi:hypothetical protein
LRKFLQHFSHLLKAQLSVEVKIHGGEDFVYDSSDVPLISTIGKSLEISWIETCGFCSQLEETSFTTILEAVIQELLLCNCAIKVGINFVKNLFCTFK